MNPDIELLQPYPFEKLAALKKAIKTPSELSHIPLSVGEPKHDAPQIVLDELHARLQSVTRYPSTRGQLELRNAIATWLKKRFHLKQIDPETEILPVNGTREGLFSIAKTVINANPQKGKAKVAMPNPFYQIYEGATLLSGAEPLFINCDKSSLEQDFSQVSDEEWQDCQLLYICTPGNPTGKVLSKKDLKELIQLADEHDFIIVSDECYSELYFDEAQPPTGLLEVCAELGRNDYKRCLAFHSLSKRSNLPGLRSGFAAGDKTVLNRFFQYRTYHGCAMPFYAQAASIVAWQDENHVIENRNLYRQKFSAVNEILSDVLDFQLPDAGFYLWPKSPINDDLFAQKLFAEQHITVLPGRFLARDTQLGNPGEGRVRMALVATLEECVEAAERIKECCLKL